MDSITVNGLTLYYDQEGAYALDLVQEACVEGIHIMQDAWHLDTPAECRAYIMTSLEQYLSHAPPRAWRFLLTVTKPLWRSRFEALWEVAGGWEQQFGNRHTFGVKPPHLLEAADKSIGERIFVHQENINIKVQQNTCHELTHAFTSHLKLPMWLKEGLAMVSVDKYAGKPTIKPETLDLLANAAHDTSPGSYRQARISDPDILVYHTVRGYWLTRFIEETQPELLLELLKQPYKPDILEDRVADKYRLDANSFWHQVNGMIVSHFKMD